MNSAIIIKKQLEKVGNTAYLKDGDWVSTPFYINLEPLWKKKSSLFEDELERLGRDRRRYYRYIGPYDHKITELSDGAELIFNEKYYEFKRRDAVMAGDKALYYTGIVREKEDGEYVEY